jgi:hypothetical protein
LRKTFAQRRLCGRSAETLTLPDNMRDRNRDEICHAAVHTCVHISTLGHAVNNFSFLLQKSLSCGYRIQRPIGGMR